MIYLRTPCSVRPHGVTTAPLAVSLSNQLKRLDEDPESQKLIPTRPLA